MWKTAVLLNIFEETMKHPFFRINWWTESSKHQHLFDQLNVSWELFISITISYWSLLGLVVYIIQNVVYFNKQNS